PEELLNAIASSFSPLSKLIERVSQECFNDLNDVIGKMADLQGRLQSNGVNGASAVSPVSGDAQVISAEKKRTILDFANKHREKFIKLLVILQWSKRADDVKQLVKVKAWLDQRAFEFENVGSLLGQLKIDLHWFKQPNPDIRTALEALSSGTASWIPDLGYIPPNPLTPQQMQETLRNINALLSIRINLHEELPRQLKQWDVANGRATFRIPSEFEFDVFIVDEDPAARFFFLDIRFLFSPAVEIPQSQLRQVLEDRANELLGTSGLSSCYEFLHDFTLTHKINTLRRQARELTRGVWSNSIRVETIKRSLIVQYWTGSKVGKNWIEIGIASGRAKDDKATWRGRPPPRLQLRWFRGGSEVADVDIKFDWTDLSMERILKQIIARHVVIIMDLVRSGLPASPGGHGFRLLQANVSESEPADCSLMMQVNGQREPAVLTIEPTAGRIVLQPPSALSTRAEIDLNNQQHPETQLVPSVSRYLAREMQDHTERQAQYCGWRVLKNLRIERAAAAFGQEVITMSFFRGQSWGPSPWAIAATVSLGGESWWIVELADPSLGESIRSVRPIEAQLHQRGNDPHSLEPLRRIERLAIALVSISATERELKELKVPHSLEANEHLTTETENAALSQSTSRSKFTLLINTDKLLAAAERNTKSANFAYNILRLSIYKYSQRTNTVTYHVRGQLKTLKQLSETFTGVQDRDVIVQRDGRFALLLDAPFGQCCTESLTARLLSLQRTRSCAAALVKHKLQIDSINLAKIKFTYPAATDAADSTTLTAEITFSSTSNDNQAIRVNFPPTNPHRRIEALLTRNLNRTTTSNPNFPFEFFVPFLSVSLPLVRVLDTIEARELRTEPGKQTGVAFHARNPEWYRVAYRSKALTLDIRTRRVRDQFVWMIEEPHLPPIRAQGQQGQDQQASRPQKSPALADALQRLWLMRGVGWRGLRTCIMADIRGGIEDALLKLDDVV
ncbi:MED14-domain-containing protein, partial [Rhizodiscina lignyota]